MISLRVVLLFVFLLVVSPLAAQSVGPSAIDAAGGSRTIGSDTYEFAIGQVVSGNTYSGATLVVTPGVLQPNTGSTGVDKQAITTEMLSVFPAPTDRIVFLQPAFSGAGTFSYTLFDVAGKLVMDRAIQLKTGTELQQLDMSSLASGEYLLSAQWLQAAAKFESAYKVLKL